MIGTQATRWDVLLAIGAGGALGSLARYGLSEAIPHPRGGFAVATLITNVVGCLLIGVLMGVLTTMARPHRLLRPFLGVGILGGFTTFSTYVIDTLDQLTTGRTELRVRLSRSLATGSRHRAGPGATMTALLVAIGGALGAILRYLTDHHVTKRTKPAFPWGTLTVNTAGSAILGVLTAWSLHGSEPDTPLATCRQMAVSQQLRDRRLSTGGGSRKVTYRGASPRTCSKGSSPVGSSAIIGVVRPLSA